MLQAKGVGELKYRWNASGVAVIKEAVPGKLLLKRAQNSGTLHVTLALSNGGAAIASRATITVQEPAQDAWVERMPDKDEKPVDKQFYARDDKNEGTLYCNGILREAAESVFLKVYADDKLIKTESQVPKADKTYALVAKFKPGLIQYKVEFGTKRGNTETILHTAANLVCGDAYLIDGQSNAVSTDWAGEASEYSSPWIRSFGSMEGDISKGWGNAVRRAGGQWQIGYWGMDLARHLVESQKIPICIINGAVGGTRIDQHQRNPANPTDATTIYGRYRASGKPGLRTASAAPCGIRARPTRGPTVRTAAMVGKLTSSTLSICRRPGSRTTRTCNTIMSSRFGRPHAPWVPRTTNSARPSGPCRGSTPTCGSCRRWESSARQPAAACAITIWTAMRRWPS